MDPKLLTEKGWKDVAAKFKVKDNGLQHDLATYEKLGDDKLVDRAKAIASITLHAGNLKKDKAVAAMPVVVKYLTDVLAAAEATHKQIDAAALAATKAVADDLKEKAEKQRAEAKMLEEVYQIGWNDGLNGPMSRSRLFSKAPLFQRKYEEGFKDGQAALGRILEKGPQPQPPSMSPITKEQEDASKEYTRRRQARKEFVQYLNEWWGTALPEDM